MRPFQVLGKLLGAVGTMADTVTNTVEIAGDWVDTAKQISDQERDLLLKEYQHDIQQRLQNLQEKQEKTAQIAA